MIIQFISMGANYSGILARMTAQPPPSRYLDFPATLNSRDLGGYPLAGGGQTRWGALVRSENPALLTFEGQQALIDYGIRTIIDLRFPEELSRDPSPFFQPSLFWNGESPEYHNIPLDHDEDLVWPNPASPAEIMADMYIHLLETNRRHAASVLATIANARPVGVLFHCHAGKDRTGLIAALALSAAGATREVVVADYALTRPELKARAEYWFTTTDLDPDRRKYLRILFTNLPETMALTLEYLDKTYGSVRGYLLTTPLGQDNLEKLKDRLVQEKI
jgi:protein-tyrosine phosphatase